MDQGSANSGETMTPKHSYTTPRMIEYGNVARLRYQVPKITEYGSIAKLTQHNATSTSSDSGNNAMHP